MKPFFLFSILFLFGFTKPGSAQVEFNYKIVGDSCYETVTLNGNPSIDRTHIKTRKGPVVYEKIYVKDGASRERRYTVSGTVVYEAFYDSNHRLNSEKRFDTNGKIIYDRSRVFLANELLTESTRTAAAEGITHYRNGKKWVDTTSTAGEKIIITLYDENGWISSIMRSYHDTTRHQFFYKSGKLRLEEISVKNAGMVSIKKYNPQGILLQNDDGILELQTILYDSIGNVLAKGSAMGLQKAYYKSGELLAETYYESGKITGTRKVYYRNRMIAVEYLYANGKLNGLSKIYDREGKLTTELNYKDSLLHGPATAYLEDGKIVSSTYANGKLNGILVTRNANGQPVSQMTFVNNVLNGFSVAYDNANGNDTSFFVNGVERWSNIYAPGGQLVSRSIYNENSHLVYAETYDEKKQLATITKQDTTFRLANGILSSVSIRYGDTVRTTAFTPEGNAVIASQTIKGVQDSAFNAQAEKQLIKAARKEAFRSVWTDLASGLYSTASYLSEHPELVDQLTAPQSNTAITDAASQSIKEIDQMQSTRYTGTSVYTPTASTYPSSYTNPNPDPALDKANKDAPAYIPVKSKPANTASTTSSTNTTLVTYDEHPSSYPLSDSATTSSTSSSSTSSSGQSQNTSAEPCGSGCIAVKAEVVNTATTTTYSAVNKTGDTLDVVLYIELNDRTWDQLGGWNHLKPGETGNYSGKVVDRAKATGRFVFYYRLSGTLNKFPTEEQVRQHAH